MNTSNLLKWGFALALISSPVMASNIFYDECVSSSTPEIEKTVDALRGKSRRTPCGKAYQKLNRLSTFNLKGQDLTDLTVLPAFQQVSWLLLGKNRIRDLSPLAKMPILEVIELDDNDVVDISPLADLAELELLNMEGNPLGTTVKKTEANCPTDAKSPAVAKWCAEASQ